jgi:hypothetical protein
MNIFGNIQCPHCELETRFMVEDEHSEGLALLGDVIQTEKELIETQTECDYCPNVFDVRVIVIENVLSMFLNEKEYQQIKTGEKKMIKAKQNEGLEQEKSQQLKQFHETFTSDFSLHPKKEQSVILVKGEKWVVQKVWKKEHTEKDIERRMMIPLYEEYWYEAVSQKRPDEKKWIVITDVKENNGLLLQEAPVLKNGEEIYDITDNLHKTTLSFKRELSDNYFLHVYDTLSGVRVMVYSRTEEGKEELEMDVLGESVEEALAQIEDVFSVMD